MASLEEIKLMIEHVKYKKVEGGLYLMSERIAWMPKQKNAFTISHHYVDIKTQKISTEGKAKIQLQVVLHDDTSSVFHFINPAGSAKQLEDRDKVKDLLISLLPKFKQKISKELEEKKRVLIENPHIYEMYNDLVVGGIIAAETFWRNFVDMNNFKHDTKMQSTGVSQGFMGNICPKSDGSNIVYNISFDDIQSIFKTYPAVKLKYVQNVPSKMSEKDFWTKFFQSYYVRRDQINSATNDLFADCSSKDNDDLKRKEEKLLGDPITIVDSQRELLKEDGFGLNEFTTNQRVSNASNQNLIKRYNYYSMRVLNSMEDSNKDENSKQQIKSPEKRIRLDEEINDLNNDKDSLNLKGANLKLTHIDRYFIAPKINDSTNTQSANLLKSLNFKAAAETTLKQTKEWNLNIQKLANHSLAISILVDLSPGSLLMQSNGEQNLKDEIPKVNQEEIRAQYMTATEMLKSFHMMFPPKNTEQELKFTSMKESLDAYFQQKILPLRERIQKENFSWNLTNHLEKMFNIAFKKYNTWQMKQNI